MASRQSQTDAVLQQDVQTFTEDRGKWYALIALCAGMLMIVLDATVVNVALPTIQEDLNFSQSALAWVVNAYLIAFGGLLLFSGRLGDLIGRRKVFMIGLVIFTIASLACGLAQSQGMLIGARFIQGLGGAMTSAVILGMIFMMFREPRELGKAIGVYSFVAAAGGSIGLLAGGVITQAISWHWIFFVNIPIGILTGLMVRRLVESDKGIGIEKGIDIPGAILVTTSLMLLVYTILEAANKGWGSAHTLIFGSISIVLLILLIIREATTDNPLIPFRLFHSRNVTGANLTQILFVAGMFAMFFLGALYLQQILNYDALEVGLAFLPATLLIGVLSLGFSQRLNMRFGPKATLIPSLLLIAGAQLFFSRVPVDGNYWTDIFPVMVMLGIGAGVAFPSLMTLAMSDATESDSGLASGLTNTTMQVGGAVGLAVLASIATSETNSLLASGESQAQALTGGFSLALVVGSILALFGVLVASLVLQSRAAQAGEGQEETQSQQPESASQPQFAQTEPEQEKESTLPKASTQERSPRYASEAYSEESG